MNINFRPHHFLCTLCFQGKGYSPTFVANYENIAAQLKENPDSEISVVDRTDSICAPCPHRQGAQCATQDKISGLDQAHGDVLKIQPGEVLTWTAAKQRISAKLTLPEFHRICATCSWKSLGVCEQVLTDYLSNRHCERTL